MYTQGEELTKSYPVHDGCSMTVLSYYVLYISDPLAPFPWEVGRWETGWGGWTLTLCSVALYVYVSAPRLVGEKLET